MTALSSPITQRERELGAIISAYNEVTERLKVAHERLTVEVERLREQLEEKNRELARRERLAALGEMAAGVAHEIRNPLAGIQLCASLLEKDLAEQPDAKALAARVCQGVQTLESIVSDVLAFAGDGEPVTTRVDLNELIASCLGYVEPARAKNRATVHVDEAALEVAIRADAGQLQRAILNLVFNAIDAAGSDGNVWIACSVCENAAAISVADDGPGIPEEIAQRVFNPFFTTKDSGTGLGLAIVHRIAEANGGAVGVGERHGGGAVLTLRLPLWAKEEGGIAA